MYKMAAALFDAGDIYRNNIRGGILRIEGGNSKLLPRGQLLLTEHQIPMPEHIIADEKGFRSDIYVLFRFLGFQMQCVALANIL